jgi:hypothetical protein
MVVLLLRRAAGRGHWCTWDGAGAAFSTPSGPPDEVVDGAVQRFAGGMMLWLPRADGTRTILVLSGREPREVAE